MFYWIRLMTTNIFEVGDFQQRVWTGKSIFTCLPTAFDRKNTHLSSLESSNHLLTDFDDCLSMANHFCSLLVFFTCRYTYIFYNNWNFYFWQRRSFQFIAVVSEKEKFMLGATNDYLCACQWFHSIFTCFSQDTYCAFTKNDFLS